MPKVSDSNGAEWGESDLNVFGVGAVGALSSTPNSCWISSTLIEDQGVLMIWSGGFNINKYQARYKRYLAQGGVQIGTVGSNLAGDPQLWVER